MIKKLTKSILTATTLLICSSANSANFDGPFTIVFEPEYINYCQNEIVATEFLPSAMVNFDLTETVLETALYIPLMTTLQTMMAQNSQTIINTMNKMKVEMMKIEMQEQQDRREMDTLIKGTTEGAKEEVELFGKIEESKLFSDASLGLEKEYFKQLCTNNKIKEITQGHKARKKESVKVAIPVEYAAVKQESITNTGAYLKKHQEERLEKYCSESEMMSGVCSKKSEIPNGDLQADIFLNPVGLSDSNSAFSQTKYTYNEIERKVAQDYIDNVVGILLIASPTIDELQDPRTQQFVLMYKNSIAALNLARTSFQKAHQNRVAVSGLGEQALSYLDYLEYLINNSVDQKQLDLLNSINSQGLKMALYNSMALTNKLQLEIYSQNERIKLIDAALLSQKENKAIVQEYMKSIKVN